MAGAGGLRIAVTAHGFEAAKKQLESLGRKVEPVLRGALDSTAMDVRKSRYTKVIASMFKGASFVNKRIVVKRVNARKGRFDARLIPSSSGVQVPDYRRWGYQIVNATRARILVGSFKGHKIAAGFVNPSTFMRHPLSTRSQKARNLKKPKPGAQSKAYVYNHGVQTAMGPSVAWFFKRLTTGATIKYTNQKLQNEFAKRLRKELLKGNV